MPETELQTEAISVPDEAPAPKPSGLSGGDGPGELAALLELARQSAACAREQRDYTRRQLFWTRIFACASAALAGLLACAALTFGPRLSGIVDDASGLMAQAGTVVSDLQTVTGQLVAADIPGLLSNVDQLVTDGQTGIAQALTDVQRALQVLESVDIAKLNESISNLNQVIAPLSRLFGG